MSVACPPTEMMTSRSQFDRYESKDLSRNVLKVEKKRPNSPFSDGFDDVSSKFDISSL